jgi:hypothetical protein
MTLSATFYDSTLNLSCIEYTTNSPLQSRILDVVDAITSQDSRDRGAWDTVIVKRVSLTSLYSEAEVRTEIKKMLRSGRLYESCYEILDGILFMTYVRNGDELK